MHSSSPCHLTGVLTDEGRQKVPEFILLFAVFDENKSWYRNLERSLDKFKKPEMAREYHTINGHFNSSLPGMLDVECASETWWCDYETEKIESSLQRENNTE